MRRCDPPYKSILDSRIITMEQKVSLVEVAPTVAREVLLKKSDVAASILALLPHTSESTAMFHNALCRGMMNDAALTVKIC